MSAAINKGCRTQLKSGGEEHCRSLLCGPFPSYWAINSDKFDLRKDTRDVLEERNSVVNEVRCARNNEDEPTAALKMSQCRQYKIDPETWCATHYFRDRWLLSEVESRFCAECVVSRKRW